jgi:hypothetical protein
MNIQDRLRAEHSKTLTMVIVKYIGDDKKKFKELMDVFLNSEYRISQRAAWPMSYVTIEYPVLIKPYFGKLLKKLEEPGAHPAIPRNILRIFQQIEIPETYRGKLVDLCFRFIMNQTLPVAIRAFAITTAANICRHYPELKSELLLILKELSVMPQQPAIKARIKFALKELEKGSF